VQPSEKPFDLPSAQITSQSATVLGLGFAAVVFVWRDQFDIVLLGESLVKGVAIIGAISD
jgi:hypothetical protein